jgi:hypothetical protein
VLCAARSQSGAGPARPPATDGLEDINVKIIAIEEHWNSVKSATRSPA